MNFVKKNKGIFITILIVLIVLIITVVALCSFLFSGYQKSKYGNRLAGIENVNISEEATESVKEIFKSVEGVTDVTYNLSGKICNFIVTVNKDIKPDDVKKVASKIFEKYTDDQKKFYDFQIFINSSEESDSYPVIGYKSTQNEEFSWSGKVVSDEE